MPEMITQGSSGAQSGRICIYLYIDTGDSSYILSKSKIPYASTSCSKIKIRHEYYISGSLCTAFTGI